MDELPNWQQDMPKLPDLKRFSRTFQGPHGKAQGLWGKFANILPNWQSQGAFNGNPGQEKKSPPAKTSVKRPVTKVKASAPQSQDPLSRAERAIGGAASAVGQGIKDVYQRGVDARRGVGTDLAKIKKAKSGS